MSVFGIESGMEIMNQWAVYLFAVFIPVIILYLLRPKPKDLHVPSLMFIMEIEQRRRFRSLFRRILHDPLLLMQLLALALLIMAIADPFYSTQETIRVTKDVVVVIDVSASMQAGTRLEQAKSIAAAIISDFGPNDKVSLILAENVPLVLLRQGDKNKAQSLVDAIHPKATPTGLGGAILLASDIIKGSEVERGIYAVSDFSTYEGIDPIAAQRTAFSQGISVEFIKVGAPADNCGIISARSGRGPDYCFAEVLVKNYGVEKDVRADLALGGTNADSETKKIAAGATDLFRLSGRCSSDRQEAAISLSPVDGMPADDIVYQIIPEAPDLDVLLIREKSSDEHLKFALESLQGVTVSENFPPIYPDSYSGYDTVVFQDAKPENVLGGTFPQLKDFVEAGGRLIVVGFEGLTKIPIERLADLLPVDIAKLVVSDTVPSKRFSHEVLADVDLNEILAHRYLYADEKVGSVTILELAGNPALTVWDVGSGKAVYFGIGSSGNWSDFYLKPSFPIFWHNLIYWVNKDKTAGNVLNLRTGEEFSAGEVEMRVRKPSGEVVIGTDIMVDEIGIYQNEGSGERAAASLLNDGESDVSYSIDAGSAQFQSDYNVTESQEEVVKELFWILAAVAVALLLIEWFYYKRRGSL